MFTQRLQFIIHQAAPFGREMIHFRLIIELRWLSLCRGTRLRSEIKDPLKEPTEHFWKQKKGTAAGGKNTEQNKQVLRLKPENTPSHAADNAWTVYLSTVSHNPVHVDRWLVEK